ncbi:hypothetical protein B7463_g6464, partial [Scytalidium lignicola]
MLVPHRRNNGQGFRRLGSASHSSMLGGRYIGSRIGVNEPIGFAPNAAFARGPRPQGFMEMLARIYGIGLELPNARFGGGHTRKSPTLSRRRHGRFGALGAGLRGSVGSAPMLPRDMLPRDLLEQLASLLSPPNARAVLNNGIDPLRLDPGMQFASRPPLRPFPPVLPSPIVHTSTAPTSMLIYDDYDPGEELDELLLMQMLEEQSARDQRTQEMIEEVLATYGIYPEDLMDEYLCCS